MTNFLDIWIRYSFSSLEKRPFGKYYGGEKICWRCSKPLLMKTFCVCAVYVNIILRICFTFRVFYKNDTLLPIFYYCGNNSIENKSKFYSKRSSWESAWKSILFPETPQDFHISAQ